MPKIQNSFVNQQDQVTRVTQQELQLCIKHADMTAACMTNDFFTSTERIRTIISIQFK